MFEKKNVTDLARSCCACMESFRRRCFYLFMAVLAVMALTGCSTYYGYNDIKEEFRDPMPDGAPRDVRHYAVVTAENGEASLKCFKRFLAEKNAMTGVRIVGRKELYRDYDPSWYLENPPYNAGWTDESWWMFPNCYFFFGDKNHTKTFLVVSQAEKVQYYLFPIIGQLALCIDGIHAMIISCWDGPVFLTASLVDSCLFMGRCCWTGVSSSCAWLGGRLFGWMDDWHLAEHNPGPLRMLSYSLFINLFMVQTPPYMTDGPLDSQAVTVMFDPSDCEDVKRTHVVTLVPKQRLCTRYKVDAQVFCNGKLCGSRTFQTDSKGDVKLTGFLRECVKASPLSAKDFSLEFKMSDRSGHEILARKVSFTADQVMSISAARDLAAYRRRDTDCLNKLLLSRRSHLEWRQELFTGELAIPAIK